MSNRKYRELHEDKIEAVNRTIREIADRPEVRIVQAVMVTEKGIIHVHPDELPTFTKIRAARNRALKAAEASGD